MWTLWKVAYKGKEPMFAFNFGPFDCWDTHGREICLQVSFNWWANNVIKRKGISVCSLFFFALILTSMQTSLSSPHDCIRDTVCNHWIHLLTVLAGPHSLQVIWYEYSTRWKGCNVFFPLLETFNTHKSRCWLHQHQDVIIKWHHTTRNTWEFLHLCPTMSSRCEL